MFTVAAGVGVLQMFSCRQSSIAIRKSSIALAGAAGSIGYLTFPNRIVALVRLIAEARIRVCVRGARKSKNT